jgi:hypothetical protein
MTQNNHTDHFWSGFSLGILAGGAILYAVATKRGRETVQKVLNNTESLEGNIEDILGLLQKNKLFEPEKNTKK